MRNIARCLILTAVLAMPAAAQTLQGQDAEVARQPGTAALVAPDLHPPAAFARPPVMTRAEAFARVRRLADFGRQMFSDPRLSASGRLSCASCHEPGNGFSPPSPAAVQMGGPHMDVAGIRAAPGLTYLQAVPAFTEHFHDSDDEADESVDNGPTGGLTWDGRVDTAAAQAIIPLLSPDEMANATAADVVRRARDAGYLDVIRATDGDAVADDPDRAFAALRKALEFYQQDAATFYPYNSKYDAYLDGRATLTAAEARGLEAFEDEHRGNCANCHLSKRGLDGSPPQFTDYGLIAIGIPRNPAIPANADPAYFDLGLCGPYRKDLTSHDEYCGLFRTPSLRNVARKQAFFHNGVIHDLREAVAFYATRDTDPGHWFPKAADGTVRKFDDLPERYRANLNDEAPFEGREPGGKPALNDAEIDDIVAFLHTLNDGWKP